MRSRQTGLPGMKNIAFLVKFFRDLNHLDALMTGSVYCSTPEYYRQSKVLGTSDTHESCVHAYRSSRGDPTLVVNVDDVAIQGIADITIRGSLKKEMWLHCWASLEIPADKAGLIQLITDFKRMQSEFGFHYAVIPHSNIKLFVKRLEEISRSNVAHGLIRYSEKKQDWSLICKSNEYAYQREYRFAIGDCGPLSAHRDFIDPRGFVDLIQKDERIQIKNMETNDIWLELDTNGCRSPSLNLV